MDRSAQLIVAESTRSLDVKSFVDVGLTIEEEIREIKKGYIALHQPRIDELPARRFAPS